MSQVSRQAIVSNLDCSISLIVNNEKLFEKIINKMLLSYSVVETINKISDWNIRVELVQTPFTPLNAEKFQLHFIEHGEVASILVKENGLHIWKKEEFLLERTGNDIYIKGSDLTIIYELVRKAIRQLFTFELEKGKGLRLHASSFEYKENGIAFLGHKGAGKTTALLTMIAHKEASYITNDVLEVRPKSDALQINGWPTICLIGRGTLHSIRRYSGLLPEEINAHDSSKPKIAISMEDIEKALDTRMTAVSTLRLIGYPQVNLKQANSEIKVLDRSEGLSRIGEHIIDEDKDHPDWLLLRTEGENMKKNDLDSLFNNVEFFEIILGSDSDAAYLIIRSFLEKVV